MTPGSVASSGWLNGSPRAVMSDGWLGAEVVVPIRRFDSGYKRYDWRKDPFMARFGQDDEEVLMLIQTLWEKLL